MKPNNEQVRIVIETPEQLVLFAACLGKAGMKLTAALMEAARRQAVKEAFGTDTTQK